MMILNPQARPTFLIPEHNHQEHDISDLNDNDAAWIENAEQMSLVLNDGFEAFRAFVKNILNKKDI